MDQDFELHQQAVEVARRVLSGTNSERYELGLTEPADDSRLFVDLVELAAQMLRDEEIRRTHLKAA
jgi:hypothetical protein